ncbi:hypothetical protein [Telmatospirillum sp.]|uniref:hypothetical protein n=1 Tax=Telmatospirillum sp. TaxID=2079197 RepID=UPI00283D75D8|nr:hypothetical protein [Telmatospirillum sp.]MDR3438538.1 hypothetical protein [Telmatospirillum sp.]
MRYDADHRQALDLMQMRAARKLAEIHQILVPGVTGLVDEADLRRKADEYASSLSPNEREKLRLKAIVAYSQLEQLMAEMSRLLADIGGELKKVNHQSQAVGAYNRVSRMGRHKPAFM